MAVNPMSDGGSDSLALVSKGPMAKMAKTLAFKPLHGKVSKVKEIGKAS